MAQAPHVKGRWFGGDRTLEQQLMGLGRLWPELSGKTVFDVGCAEGLISLECATHGAAQVTGLEIRLDAVGAANQLAIARGLHPRVHFMPSDVNEPPMWSADVVLLLAILHKLKYPNAAAARFAAAARELVVVRLPPMHAPRVKDSRSGNVPHDVGHAILDSGFVLEHSGLDGPFGEWMGYYRRVKS